MGLAERICRLEGNVKIVVKHHATASCAGDSALFTFSFRRQFPYILDCSDLQSQKAVTAYFTSKQLLPFGFARQLTALHQVGVSVECIAGR